MDANECIRLNKDWERVYAAAPALEASPAAAALTAMAEALSLQLQECAARLRPEGGVMPDHDVFATITACADSLAAVERARRSLSAN